MIDRNSFYWRSVADNAARSAGMSAARSEAATEIARLRSLLLECSGVLRIVDEGDDVFGPDGVTDLRRRVEAELGVKP